MVDVVGGTTVSGDDTISTVTGLSGTIPTTEQIYDLINQIDVAIFNMIVGGGVVDYQENGPVGFSVLGSRSLAELRRLREMYVSALTDPEKMLDAYELMTQWDDPSE